MFRNADETAPLKSQAHGYSDRASKTCKVTPDGTPAKAQVAEERTKTQPHSDLIRFAYRARLAQHRRRTHSQSTGRKRTITCEITLTPAGRTQGDLKTHSACTATDKRTLIC